MDLTPGSRWWLLGAEEFLYKNIYDIIFSISYFSCHMGYKGSGMRPRWWAAPASTQPGSPGEDSRTGVSRNNVNGPSQPHGERTELSMSMVPVSHMEKEQACRETHWAAAHVVKASSTCGQSRGLGFVRACLLFTFYQTGGIAQPEISQFKQSSVFYNRVFWLNNLCSRTWTSTLKMLSLNCFLLRHCECNPVGFRGDLRAHIKIQHTLTLFLVLVQHKYVLDRPGGEPVGYWYNPI